MSVGDELDRVGRGAGQLDGGGHGAGRAADLDREDQGGQVVVRVEDAGQPLRGLEPEGGRHGVLGQRARRPSGCRGAPRPASASARICARSSSRTAPTASRAPIISAVSTTSWLVSPRCSQRAAVRLTAEQLAQQADQRDDRVAGRLGGSAMPPRPRRTRGRPGRRGRRRGGRRDARRDERLEPGRLDRDHRAQERRVGEVIAGALVAGPEEIRHGISLVPRVGQEHRLALALQPDVEDVAVLVRPRDQGPAALRVERGQQRVGRQGAPRRRAGRRG